MKKTGVICRDEEMLILERSSILCVDYKNIIGIFCDHPYLKIKILDRKDKYIYYTIEEISYLLPDFFILCNRSSIVNIH